MKLRENWEIWHKLEQKKLNEELTKEEYVLFYNAGLYVFDHMEDYTVPYSLLMSELKKFMGLIKSKGVWELQITKNDKGNNEYYYSVDFVNAAEDKPLHVVRLKYNKHTLEEMKGEKEADININLLRDTKWDGITLPNVTRSEKDLPVASDALLEVLWKVVKECKVLRLKEEKLGLSQQMQLTENRQHNLEKEMETIDQELEALSK